MINCNLEYLLDKFSFPHTSFRIKTKHIQNTKCLRICDHLILLELGNLGMVGSISGYIHNPCLCLAARQYK